jgi:hypothetical protein
MTFDNISEEMSESEKSLRQGLFKSSLLLIFLGIFSSFASFLSVFIATNFGITNLSIQNGTMFIVLSILILVFLLIKTLNYLYNRYTQLFFIGVIVIIVNLFVLIFKIIEFIQIPVPII